MIACKRYYNSRLATAVSNLIYDNDVPHLMQNARMGTTLLRCWRCYIYCVSDTLGPMLLLMGYIISKCVCLVNNNRFPAARLVLYHTVFVLLTSVVKHYLEYRFCGLLYFYYNYFLCQKWIFWSLNRSVLLPIVWSKGPFFLTIIHFCII